MKLFEVQTELTSYTYSVVKIIICISMILLSIFRDLLFRLSNSWANFVVALICFVLTIISILCLYISIGELFHTYKNRKNKNHLQSDVKQLTIDAIAKIVSENDIVEIEVCTDNKTIKIGVSSDCKYSSSVFYDKLFYISGTEYKTIKQFIDVLIELFPEKTIAVSKIDNLPLK